MPDGTGFVKLFDFEATTSGTFAPSSLYFDGTFLYGMTNSGGANNSGTAFRIRPDGTDFLKLLDFDGTGNGSDPYGTFFSDGTFLYGMTSTGGANDLGTIFKIFPNGTGYTKLLDFNGATNGSFPLGTLISDGTFLYGVTSGGGTANRGTIFKILPDGTGYVRMHNFNNTNGSEPWGKLLLIGTTLYGMTSEGGSVGDGTIFRINTNGTGFSKLFDFNSSTNFAELPFGDLVTDGSYLYGHTYFGGVGGTNDYGVLFRIRSDGTGFTRLHDFTTVENGWLLFGSPLVVGTTLYGMTQQGGVSTGDGTVYSFELPNQNFITQWNLATAGSGATQLSFGTATSGVANYTWQEISPGSATGSGSWSGATLTITGLPAGSTIRLQIAPTNFQRFNVSSGLDEDRLTQVEQWGTTAWTSMQNAFRGCTNLQITATDVPNLSGVTDMSSMFESCRSLNSPSNMGTWNTATVTNMTFMFYDATVFNQDIGAWNTSSVTNMNTMFSEALAFNQDIGSWNTAAVTDMSDMFGYTTAFNQDISGWNTEAVTDMSFMFRGASAFNQDISSWNTAAVTDMRGMFRNATAFNQNIGAWNLGAVSDIRFMLDNTGMDCINYSATLIGWSSNPSTPNGRTLEATGRQYGTNAVAARSNLTTTKGWTITGDAPSGSVCALAGPPTISSFAPSSGPVGITVTITGTNFSSTPANNTVTFNGTTALVTVSTTTTLTVTVPIGATTGPISVTVGGNTATSATDFTVTTLIITQQPASSTDACTGSSATLTTAATGTTNITYQWQKFNGSVFVDLVNNSTYAGVATATLTINNITLSEAGDYQCVIGGDFVTPVISSTATLVVNATPASPDVTGGSNCIGSSITLTASGGTDGQYRWYPAASGGTALPGETNGSYTTPALFTTQNYYVAIHDGVCESGRSVATATVLGPAAPGVTDAGRCDAGTVTLSATGGASGNYRWYTVPSGGAALPGETNDTFTTPSLTATTTYYVAVNDGTCESARNAVTATIASPPAAPTVTPVNTCGPGIVTLAAAGSTDGNYRWYTSSTGGTALPGETNASYTTPALTATTIFYVSVNDGACESVRVPATAEVLAAPAPPTAADVQRCEAGPVTLTATGGADGQYRWYTTASGGTPDASQQNGTFTTATLNATTAFYVSLNDGNCESNRTEVEAVVETLQAPVVTSSQTPAGQTITLCDGETVTLSAPGGFVAYGWSNGADTEQIVVSEAGTYAVTVTSSAGCLSPPSVSFVVVLNNCTSNQPPVISTASAATEIEGTATINLQALISDPDNNADITTLRIIEFPLSGAAASIDASGNLVINYAGISFSGQDQLTIEVCDSEGICVQQQIFIEVTGDIVVMNGLSPNGDNANDYFQIKYINVLESTRQNRVTIFNRWGDAVFETTNYNNRDNVFIGQNQNGNDLPSGTYLYRIEFSGGRSPLTGYLVLKR